MPLKNLDRQLLPKGEKSGGVNNSVRKYLEIRNSKNREIWPEALADI